MPIITNDNLAEINTANAAISRGEAPAARSAPVNRDAVLADHNSMVVNKLTPIDAGQIASARESWQEAWPAIAAERKLLDASSPAYAVAEADYMAKFDIASGYKAPAPAADVVADASAFGLSEGVAPTAYRPNYAQARDLPADRLVALNEACGELAAALKFPVSGGKTFIEQLSKAGQEFANLPSDVAREEWRKHQNKIALNAAGGEEQLAAVRADAEFALKSAGENRLAQDILRSGILTDATVLWNLAQQGRSLKALAEARKPKP